MDIEGLRFTKLTLEGTHWDATAEETPRRSGQSQGDTKREISGPRSPYEATVAYTARIGESRKSPVRILGYSDTKKNIEIGLQKDATAKEGLNTRIAISEN